MGRRGSPSLVAWQLCDHACSPPLPHTHTHTPLARLNPQISVLVNVKAPVLDRIARMCGATIVNSANHLDKVSPGETLGTCSAFALRTFIKQRERQRLYRGRRGARTYAVLAGCPPALGCTLLLRGATSHVLQQAKAVLLWAVYVAYNLRLESALLWDEGAAVSSRPLRPLFAHSKAALMAAMMQQQRRRSVALEGADGGGAGAGAGAGGGEHAAEDPEQLRKATHVAMAALLENEVMSESPDVVFRKTAAGSELPSGTQVGGEPTGAPQVQALALHHSQSSDKASTGAASGSDSKQAAGVSGVEAGEATGEGDDGDETDPEDEWNAATEALIAQVPANPSGGMTGVGLDARFDGVLSGVTGVDTARKHQSLLVGSCWLSTHGPRPQCVPPRIKRIR